MLKFQVDKTRFRYEDAGITINKNDTDTFVTVVTNKLNYQEDISNLNSHIEVNVFIDKDLKASFKSI
jgi:hypothetical protein